MEQVLTQKKAKNSRKVSKSTEDFKCIFCGKIFKREASLFRHTCRLKIRYLARDKKPNRIAYQTYRLFYENIRKKPPSVEKFEDSNVYGAFVRFAYFIVENDVIYPENFIHYVLNRNISIDKWCSHELYKEYLIELMKVETWERALERNILLMQQWEMQDSSRHWTKFFKEISAPRAVQYICNGRISPWALMLSSSGKELLERLSDEQIELIDKRIDFNFWNKKFQSQPREVEQAMDFLKDIL